MVFVGGIVSNLTIDSVVLFSVVFVLATVSNSSYVSIVFKCNHCVNSSWSSHCFKINLTVLSTLVSIVLYLYVHEDVLWAANLKKWLNMQLNVCLQECFRNKSVTLTFLYSSGSFLPWIWGGLSCILSRWQIPGISRRLQGVFSCCMVY